MRSVRGARLMISGGASGMGRLYAIRAVREGAAAVSLWDLDEAGLERVAAELAQLRGPRGVAQTRVHTRALDMRSSEAVEAAARETAVAIGVPDILVNNAGIVAGNAYFWETDNDAVTRATIEINTLAHCYVTREFLPDMIADRGRAKRILNVSSAASTLANPRMSMYAASKWAMTGWSDSLRLELRQAGHEHVRVTTFCPSYVKTGMFQGARGMFLTPLLEPDEAVDAAWTAMLRGQAVRFAPRPVWLARALRGLLPVPLWDVLADWMRVTRSMQQFTGRR
ncbi:SDR family NAD(P)-dependent oxidoreductase [Leucobacter sp. M11]|uniref:SDR family NAD(P)-dependent oxidoreductase n=1 Tax=Leucobacter sp. M11 TaxID=2993565 RepID=UPI002D803879|nr:SDR family NAD(P)-dependent oxidoreductase [Leucobacter sp. M11]MEB4616530.1 SDR family NAD(P)-dependent oxidoreductase [Leucobacter sp. M11]